MIERAVHDADRLRFRRQAEVVAADPDDGDLFSALSQFARRHLRTVADLVSALRNRVRGRSAGLLLFHGCSRIVGFESSGGCEAGHAVRR